MELSTLKGSIMHTHASSTQGSHEAENHLSASSHASYTVTHVLNNNAVIAQSPAGVSVLVGKGLGFGRKIGDVVHARDVDSLYVAAGSDLHHYSSHLEILNSEVLKAVARGVEYASSVLGELHPSVYLLLTDHLAFAVARQKDGMKIPNPLVGEIRAFFPDEFAVALSVLQQVNMQLDVALPLDEAAYITLHLSAARTGESVREPLSQAHEVARVIGLVGQLIGEENLAVARAEVTTSVASLIHRIEQGNMRECPLGQTVRKELPVLWQQAHTVIDSLAHSHTHTESALAGEVAFLAVNMCAWAGKTQQKKRRELM